MQNKLRGNFNGISAYELEKKIKSEDHIVLIDVCNPDEFAQARLGIGEILVPLGQIRTRLEELPKDKNREIVTWCKISLRGYEAALILKANVYTNVKVLEGGIAAWPFKMEI